MRTRITGQRLCLMDNEYVSGIGTYEHQGYIHSSVAGIVKVTGNTDENPNSQSVNCHLYC